MAILSANWVNGLVSEKAAGGYEIDLALGALALAVFLLGPGRFSLDRILRVEHRIGVPRWATLPDRKLALASETATPPAPETSPSPI